MCEIKDPWNFYRLFSCFLIKSPRRASSGVAIGDEAWLYERRGSHTVTIAVNVNQHVNIINGNSTR